MCGTTSQDLSGVSETLLITLYLRAMETQRPDALIKDEKAVALVTQMSYDFAWIRQIKMAEFEKVAIILRNREFDRYARDFLIRRPEAVVVHIGCGLDSRFERVAERNSKVEWYDLDLPEIIALRRKLIGDEGERYHLLACSVLEDAWMERVSAHHQRDYIFMAEGVFPYLEEAQVKQLVLSLHDHFPGAELVFDAMSPIEVWTTNLQMSPSKLSARLRWGIWRGQELEKWDEGIHLLDEWGWLDPTEPRQDKVRWMRHIPLLARALCIYHYSLGKAEG
jgi:O-methyltransferase involved in polyketide biosynthesis